jgi:hypothetical protein
MTKLAADRFDTAAKTLNLTPEQAAAIKPLFHSKYVDMGQVKDVYRGSDKSAAAKKTAKDSLKAIHDKYNAQINTILTPGQPSDAPISVVGDLRTNRKLAFSGSRERDTLMIRRG